MEKKIEANKARQGPPGRPVLIVLIAALILAAIVWFGVGMFGSAIEPSDPVGGQPTEQPQDSQVAPQTAPSGN